MNPADAAKNYYAILGAPENASQDEIERLYKHLAIRHHPDRGGNAEKMKAINEAYRVLGNEFTRCAYDSRHKRADEGLRAVVPPLSPPTALLPDTVLGRLMRAILILLGGLLFLFVVRIVYIRFMWPILLLAVFVVLFGVWKVHATMIFERNRFAPAHALRRYEWVQELAFWSIVAIGTYVVYRLMDAM